MRNLYGVRVENREKYLQCICLRKQGLSYTEIIKILHLSKSTINCWLQLAGLTLSPEHLKIQASKFKQNNILGTEASKIIRKQRAEKNLNETIQRLKNNFNDPLFITGIMLYEAEGCKGSGGARFSNSDYRLLQVFIKFIKKYFPLNMESSAYYRLAIHESRSKDLNRIKTFWSKKLQIPIKNIKVTWKHNIVTSVRENLDYVGQMDVTIRGEPLMTRKLLAISDIILRQQLKSVL